MELSPEQTVAQWNVVQKNKLAPSGLTGDRWWGLLHG